MGIEPTQPAWKAGVLPLNYTRVLSSVDHNTIYTGCLSSVFFVFCKEKSHLSAYGQRCRRKAMRYFTDRWDRVTFLKAETMTYLKKVHTTARVSDYGR